MQWLLERGVQFADVAFYAGESGKELGWAHAAVLCAVSPYFRQLLLGPKTRWGSLLLPHGAAYPAD